MTTDYNTQSEYYKYNKDHITIYHCKLYINVTMWVCVYNALAMTCGFNIKSNKHSIYGDRKMRYQLTLLFLLTCGSGFDGKWAPPFC